MPETLEEWWRRVNADDRALFINHRDDDPLPSGVVSRFLEYDIGPLAVQERDDGGSNLVWPRDVSAFLEFRAADAGDP